MPRTALNSAQGSTVQCPGQHCQNSTSQDSTLSNSVCPGPETGKIQTLRIPATGQTQNLRRPRIRQSQTLRCPGTARNPTPRYRGQHRVQICTRGTTRDTVHHNVE